MGFTRELWQSLPEAPAMARAHEGTRSFPIYTAIFALLTNQTFQVDEYTAL